MQLSPILSPVCCCFLFHDSDYDGYTNKNNPARCEVWSEIWYLNAEGHNASKIHYKLYEIYGSTVTSEGNARQWCCMLTEGHKCTQHNEQRSRRHSVQVDNLLEHVNSRILEIVTLWSLFLWLNFLKFHVYAVKNFQWARWLWKMLTCWLRCAKNDGFCMCIFGPLWETG